MNELLFSFLTVVIVIAVLVLFMVLLIGTMFSFSWALYNVIFPAIDRVMTRWFK